MKKIHLLPLLEASLKKIGAGVNVICENRSVEKVNDNPAPNTRGDERILSRHVGILTGYSHCMMLLLVPLKTCLIVTSLL